MIKGTRSTEMTTTAPGVTVPRAQRGGDAMASIDLPYLVRDVDRYERVRFYVRRKGHKKVRLPDDPSTPEFMATYYAALEQTSDRRAAPRGEPPRGSLRAACMGYFASPEFKKLDARTR
jgi:integrase/recombinase XerD